MAVARSAAGGVGGGAARHSAGDIGDPCGKAGVPDVERWARNVAGLLMSVGYGGSPPERVGAVLASLDRKTNAATAPPDGLYLTAVRYPPGFGLPPQSAIICRTLE